jgi:hypothetical protein
MTLFLQKDHTPTTTPPSSLLRCVPKFILSLYFQHTCSPFCHVVWVVLSPNTTCVTKDNKNLSTWWICLVFLSVLKLLRIVVVHTPRYITIPLFFSTPFTFILTTHTHTHTWQSIHEYIYATTFTYQRHRVPSNQLTQRFKYLVY